MPNAMPSSNMPPHRTLPLVAALCALGASTAALAQTQDSASPYYIGVSQSIAHDSNVFRSNTNEVSETYYVTSLLAGLDQRFGRQRLFADGVVQLNRYRNVDRLDNKSYSFSTGLDWETVGLLSGDLRYNTRNSLADLGGIDGTGIVSDLTTNQFSAAARYGLASHLRFELEYDHRRLDYDNAALSSRDYSQNAISGSVHWTLGGAVTLGLGLRGTRGETPEYGLGQTPPLPAPYNDKMKRRDVDLTAVWTPTGFSTINARLSATKEEHTLNRTADLSETTGALSWDYRPTGRLSFNLTLARDTGVETAFDGTRPAGTTALPVDNNRLTNSASLDARYLLTSKISLAGGARVRKAERNNGAKETIDSYLFGITYMPTRTITTRCSLVRESRDGSGGTVGATDYRVTQTACGVDFVIR